MNRNGRWICLLAGAVALGLTPTLFAQAGMGRSATAYPTGDPNTSILMIERLTPTSIRVGVPFTYEIHLRNLTRKNLDNLQLTERLPNNFEVRSIEPQPNRRDGNTASWSIASLVPNRPTVVKVTGVSTTLGKISACNTVTFSVDTCQETQIVEPELKIEKTMPAEVLLCDPIPLTIRVTNTGSGTATGVKIEDQLPDGLTTMQGSRSVNFDVGVLAPGASRDFQATAKATRTGNFTNTATVTESGGKSASASASTMVRQPVLQVTKTGPALRYLGRPATYEITVTNTGDGPARDTMLTDLLDADSRLVRASDNGQPSGGRVTWRLGTLAPGDSKKVTVEVLGNKRKTISNTATAKAYCAEGSASASTEIRGIPALLLEVIDVEDPIEVGSDITYVITVTNQGTAEGTGIVIGAEMPTQQSFVKAEGPTSHEAQGQTIKYAPLPSLNVGAKATYRIVARGTGEGDVRFRVKMTADQLTSPVEETESTNIYR